MIEVFAELSLPERVKELVERIPDRPWSRGPLWYEIQDANGQPVASMYCSDKTRTEVRIAELICLVVNHAEVLIEALNAKANPDPSALPPIQAGERGL